MWNLLNGKSNGAMDDRQSQSSRRKGDQRSTRRRSESAATSDLASKPSRKDDRDRASNSTAIIDSSTKRSAFPGTASASIASSYTTAKSRTGRDDNDGRERASERKKKDRSPSPESRRDKKGRNDSREKKERKRDKLDRRDRMDEDIAKVSRRSEYDHSSGRTQESTRGDFNAQIGSSGFVQFPGQYEGGFVGGPPNRAGDMSSHVPDQFPGQFPTESAGPYRPPLSVNEGGPGLAADYYGNVGQSVSEQPGIGPQQPSRIIGVEPHLQPASSTARPPSGSSTLGGVGAAASFFSDHFDVGATNVPHQASSSKPGSTYTESTIRPNSQNTSTSASAMPIMGAAAAGAAAGYLASTALNSHEHRPLHASSTAGSHSNNSQPPPSYSNGYYDASSQYMQPTTPGKHSSHSSTIPSYGAGAVGLAAAAHHHHHQSSPYHSISQPFATGSMAQKHRHRGPMSTFVDFFKDPEGVAQFEEYTEYIGVCKGCFAPGSSPRDAPRKHNYRRRRSNERYGSSMRVDKDSRYSSSDNEKRRKKNKSWLEAGITGYGLGKVGQTLFNQGHTSDDAYSVKSSRVRKSHGALSPDRKSYTSRGATRRSFEAPHRYRSRSRDHVETGITSDGKVYKKDSQGGIFGTPSVTTYRVRRRSKSRSRSRSHSRNRSSRFAQAAAGATIGAAVLESKSRRRDSSPERELIRVKEGDKRSSNRSSGHGKRHEPRYESNSSVGSHIEGRRRTHRKKKNGGFFSFGNSSSSTDTGSSSDGRFNKRKEKRHRDNGRDEHRKAELAVAGLSAAAAALTLEQTRQNNKLKRRGDVVAVKEAKEKHRNEFERRRKSKLSSNSDEDVWESASEGDADSISSDLAYGNTVRRKGSRSSLSSDSSVTTKWLWRWGNNKKRSDSDKKPSSPPYAGVATSGAVESSEARKMDDIYDRQPRITMHSNSSLPLQQVYPVPTSDPSQFDVVTNPSALPAPQRFIHEQPDPLQIQHPQPVTPVSPAVYTTQSPYNHTYGVSAGGPSNYVEFAKRTVSEPISGAYHNESQQGVPGSFPEPLKATDNTAYDTPRESKPHRRDSSPGRYAAGVVQTSETPRRRTSLRESSQVVHFDLPEDKSEILGRAEPHNIERDFGERPRKERYEVDSEQFEREAKAVRRGSQEGPDLDKRRQENIFEVEDRQHIHEKSSTHGKSISWAVPAVIGAAAIASATNGNQGTRSDDSEEQRLERRRRREARRGTSEESSHNVEAFKSRNDSSGRSQDQSIWQEAAITDRSPSHEGYAEFFAPTELLSKSPQYKEGAAEADADSSITAYEVPEVITIEPNGFRDSWKAPAYKFGPDGEEIDPDPIPPPWVPKLKLVSPTPQPSSVHGSEAGDEIPITDPQVVAKEISEVLREAHETTQDVPQDTQTPEYTIIEPNGDRQRNTVSLPKQESIRAVGSNAATSDMYEVEEPLKSPPRKSIGEFGDDLEFAGTLAAGLSEAGFDPSIVVDDPTFRRRESPPGSEKAGTYQSPVAEILPTKSNEISKSQVVSHEHDYVDDEVTSHMPGAFDEDEQVIDLAETESRLSKKERKKKDKQAKRQDINGSHHNGLREDTLEQSRDIVTPPEIQDQEPPVLVEDPEEYFSDGAQPTVVSSPFAIEGSKDRKVNEKSRRKGSALEDDISVATAPTIQAHADTYLSDEARSMSASVQAASGTTKDKKKKKKSRRTGSAIDDEIAIAIPALEQARDVAKDFSDDARSSAAIPKEKRKKKSKRGDSTYEEEFSVVSSSTTRDEARSIESQPKSKKGGLFGLFGRSSVDVSEPSHPGTGTAVTETADVEEPKRRTKKRSKDRPSYRNLEEIGPVDADGDDDPATISGRTTLQPEVSIPASTGHDPFLPSNDRLTNPEDEVSGRSLEVNNNDLSSSEITQDHDSHNHSQPISFLGMRQDLPSPPDIHGSADLVPKKPTIERSEPFFDAIAESVIASRRSSSPTGLHRAIEPDQGTNSLPSSPTGRPKVPSQRLSELQKAESPQHTPSPTAVPFHFRIPPSSPSASRASASQPHTPSAPETISAPSRPKLRPRSTEFKSSNEFRPLWLVSKHASRREGPIDEIYPSLPSSHTTSRSSSVHDADEYSYGSTWDHFQAPEDHERSGEETAAQIGVVGTEVDLGLLDSQQPTPTAASFPAAIREDIQASLEHRSLEQSNLAAIKDPLDDLPPLPLSRPSSPAMSVTQDASRASPNLKAITLGAVLGASFALGSDHYQHDTTASSDREGNELEPEMVERDPPRVMISARAANEPVTTLENKNLRDVDRSTAERKSSNFSTSPVEKPSPFDQPLAMLSSNQRGDVAPLSSAEQRKLQEQDTQDAVKLVLPSTSDERFDGELERKGRNQEGAPLSTGLQSSDVGEPLASDISTMTSIHDTGKRSSEELAVQEAIDSVKKSNSMVEARAQEEPTLTGVMPVAEVVERMSNAAEGPTGESDTVPASNTINRDFSSEFQLQAAPAKSRKRSGKNKKRSSSATLREPPVEESSMTLKEVIELGPSDRFKQSSFNEVKNPSTDPEVYNPARAVPTAETPGAIDSVLDLPGPADDYDKPVSSSKRKAQKGVKTSKEPAQPEPELEHVSGAFEASQPLLDENGPSTNDAPMGELILSLGHTSDSLPHQTGSKSKLASVRKFKKSRKNRESVHDDKDLEQESLTPKEGAALEANALGAEAISEGTLDSEDIPRSHSHHTTVNDALETRNSIYIPPTSTLSPGTRVQPEDIPLPESTDIDLFVTTPPLEASPSEIEPSYSELATANSSTTQVLPQHCAKVEERSQSSPVTDQQNDPTDPAPTEAIRGMSRMEEEKPGQSSDGEALFNTEYVDTVGLNKAMTPRERSITIAYDPDALPREISDLEPHHTLEHGPLHSHSVDSEIVGNIVVPDEVGLPEVESLKTDKTIHDDLPHTDTFAKGAAIIEEPFNEADFQGIYFAKTSAVGKEEERQPMFTDSGQTEMENRIPKAVSPGNIVGSGLSPAVEAPLPPSETAIDPSTPILSGPVEESSPLGSSLEASEPITADEVELPPSPVIADQPVSGTQVLEPRETPIDARSDTQNSFLETIANPSQFELDSQTSKSAQLDEAGLPAAQYSISGNQPISYQPHPESIGTVNDSRTEILEPLVATVDRANASPSSLSSVQQSYDQAERLPPRFDRETDEMAPNIQSSSLPKPDVFAFLDETLGEEKETHKAPMDSPTVDQVELKDGLDAPGQPAKTDTSQSVKEILAMTGPTPTEERTPPCLTALTVSSEVPVPQIPDEGNDDDLSGLSKKQKKKAKKSRTNQVLKPAIDFAEGIPTAEPFVALTNTAEDVQTILSAGSADQASALSEPRPEPVVAATEFQPAEEGLDDDQPSLPSSPKSNKAGRGKYVERERPEDSFIVDTEASEAREQPFVHIESLEDKPLPEHGDTTPRLETSDKTEGLDVRNDHGMEPVEQNKETFDQLDVSDVKQDSIHGHLDEVDEERVQPVEVNVPQNHQTLYHSRSVDEIQDPELGAFKSGYIEHAEHSKETLDQVKNDIASEGSDFNVVEEGIPELMTPGKEASNSSPSIKTTEYLEPESARESVTNMKTRIEKGSGYEDSVQPGQNILVEPLELSSAEANDSSPNAKEANEVPTENLKKTQLEAESIGIAPAGPSEERSRNEALSASRQNSEEPSMSPVDIKPQTPVASEISDSAKAVEEALESQDVLWPPSISKKEKKKAMKKNKIVVSEDEPHLPDFGSHEASGATKPASDQQVQASQSSKKDKKRGKKIKQAFEWEESVASLADNDASTVQHELVLDTAPEQSTVADENVEVSKLDVSEKAVNERSQTARDEVDLDSATRPVEAAISSKAETYSNLPVTKKDKKKKKKAITSQFESFDDDVPTPVPEIEAELLTTDTVHDSPAEPVDLTTDAPTKGLEDTSNRKKKSKKDKKREKLQLSPWDEETVPQREVVGTTEAVSDLPAQESSETVAEFANDNVDSSSTSRKSKKGRKGKKTSLQSSFDDSESTTLENVATTVVPMAESPVQSVQGSLPTIDEVQVLEPAAKAVDESGTYISLNPADNLDEESITEIQPSDGQNLDFEEPESTQVVTGKKGKKNKSKKKERSTVSWDDNETPHIETTEANSSSPRTTPTPAPNVQDQNAPLQAEYEHEAHGSDVQTPVTAVRGTPIEEAIHGMNNFESSRSSPVEVERSTFSTELQSQPDPGSAFNFSDSKWERSEMQPRVLDLDEEVQEAAPQVVEESIPEGSSKASFDQLIDQPIRPHVPDSVEELDQQQVEDPIHQYNDEPVQPHLGKSVNTQVGEPPQSRIEESLETPFGKPSQPHLAESVRSLLGERSELHPAESLLRPESGFTASNAGEHSSLETKEPAVPDEKEAARVASQEPLEGDSARANIGPYLEKPNTEPPPDHYESSVRSHQVPNESQPQIPKDAHRNTVLSQGLDQKQNLATSDADADRIAEASQYNSNTLGDTLTAVPVSTSAEQAHKRSFFEDEGPEVTVEDEAAMEPPPKTTRTDADPPSQKIVDMEEELFARPTKSKKKKYKKAGYESSTVDKPHQSRPLDNEPSSIASGTDQADTSKTEHLPFSAERSQPRDFPGLSEVQDEDFVREASLGNRSTETMNEAHHGTDHWEPQVKKGKKGKKRKSTANENGADAQVIETNFVDFSTSEHPSRGNLDLDQPLKSTSPAVNAGNTDVSSEYATNDDPSIPYQQQETSHPAQSATMFDDTASLLATNSLSGPEALPPQHDESSPFTSLRKSKKSKKKKQAEPIIWEDDIAIAPVIDQGNEVTIHKPTPIPEVQSATHEFEDLQYRPDEPPRSQSSYPEINVGALNPSAQLDKERNDYFGAQAQEAGMGTAINPQVPPFEPQEQGDDKPSIYAEVPGHDIVGLADKTATATKTEFDNPGPPHNSDGKAKILEEQSEMIDEPYQRERIESQPMPERFGPGPEGTVVGKGEDLPVLANKEALHVDDQAIEQAQNPRGWVADEDNGLQEQQITHGASDTVTVPGNDDTQPVDPSMEGDVFAIPVSKKSKKKSRRRAYATETIDPRDLEDPAYKEAIDQRKNISMSRSRSPSPRQSPEITEDPTQGDHGAKFKEGQASAVGIMGAGAFVAENLGRGDSKKSGKTEMKRKGKVWEGEELNIPETTTSSTQKEAKETLPFSEPNRQVRLTPPESPGYVSTHQLEDDTYNNRQVNRDSAVHIPDSPIISDSLPTYRMVRDSGYQDTEASPIVGLQRSVSFERTSTTEAPIVEQIAPDKESQVHGTQETQVAEASTANPINMPIEADTGHATRVLSPVLETGDAPRSQNDHMDFANDSLKVSNDQPTSRPDNDSRLEPMSLDRVLPSDQRSAAGPDTDALDIPSSFHTQGDDREPSPVSPSSKDRSSVLFQSSPSTREELASIQQRSSSPLHDDKSGNERAISPVGGDKGATTGAAANQSLFGGPFTANNERPSPPISPTGMEDSARRPLDTIREYSPEQSPLQRKTRTRPHSPSPERGNRRRRTADRQEAQRGHVPEINTSNLISTDDIISGMVNEEEHVVDLERSRSRTTDNRAPSRQSVISASGEAPKPRSFSGASIRSSESINAIIRTPDQIRSASGLSYHSSGTPPLRRVDRSVSGDLRAKSLAKQSDPAPQTIASSSTYDPTKDKGKDRMADVYEGWGDVHGASPMSPTRPQSVMRKRQSMQILDLESRLDQLVSENRLLQDAKIRAERNLDDASQDSKKQSSALREAIETRDLYLRQKDGELQELRRILEGFQSQVSQLTEVNQSLTASRDLASEYEQRHTQLEAEHAHTHEQWQNTARELDELRQQHSNLSGGMEAIVKHEIDVAVEARNVELRQVREELEAAKEQVRALQQQIVASRSRDDFIVERDEDYFDGQCQKLCQHVQQWVLRFSKFSDMKACFLASEINEEKIVDRMENAILDGSDVDTYLADRVKRRDVFMSVVMTMVWEYIFTRYLFGMDREQRQKLKSLEKTLSEVGPASAVNKWRATTLTLLAKRDAFTAQRSQDTEAVVNEIYSTLATFLPPPSHLVPQIQESLRKVIASAVDLSIEMRTQRAEYIMLPPLQPEYDTNGDLARKVYFNASLMNERSGATSSNEALEAQQAVVRLVLFPLVVKKGDESGVGEEQIVVCPAQVLTKPGQKDKKTVRVVSAQGMAGVGESVVGSDVGMGGMI